jgi:hypothetical protein
MDSLGDRRSRTRFEVVGPLGGVLELVDVARVVDISPYGALVAAAIAPAIDSTMTLRLAFAHSEISVSACVRHFRHTLRARESEYLVGLEFLSAPSSLASVIDDLLSPDSSEGLL